MCDITIITHIYFSDTKPKLLQLLQFPVANRKLNLTKCFDDYFQIGTFLLEDNTGVIMRGIENQRQRDSSGIMFDVFRRWLGGEGAQPCTWSTLLRCLRDCESNTLADEIESAF